MKKRKVTPVGDLCQRLSWEDLDVDALRRLIRMARAEDLFGFGLREKPKSRGDITTRTMIGRGTGDAFLTARVPMLVCGLPLIDLIAKEYRGGISSNSAVQDGAFVKAGTVLAQIKGDTRQMLQAERVLLNFLQMLSGIATHTAAHVRAMGKTRTRLLDTRKTTPGFRMLEKYAVACGGAWNHRLGLFDRVLIKDNHLAASNATRGDRLAEAVRNARVRSPGFVVEVEIDQLEQLPPVLDAGADVVLLDNFPLPHLRRAVTMANGRTRTEASGGISLRTLPKIADMGLDFISSGALVHQSTWVDIGLDWN